MKDQLTNDPNFAASIENTGVHDPLFLHETPVADFIILTFEGAAFQQLRWEQIFSLILISFCLLLV